MGLHEIDCKLKLKKERILNFIQSNIKKDENKNRKEKVSLLENLLLEASNETEYEWWIVGFLYETEPTF